MRSILSSSKAIAKILSGKNQSLELSTGFRWFQGHTDTMCERFAQARYLVSFSPYGNPCIGQLFYSGKELAPSVGNLHRYNQGRRFLGCGDEEAGTVLSKIYEKRRVIGCYSAVVAAFDLYEEFLPWCQRSRIIERNSDGSFDAGWEIGFKFLVESYVSHTNVSESSLFDHLINVWEFEPGPVPGT